MLKVGKQLFIYSLLFLIQILSLHIQLAYPHPIKKLTLNPSPILKNSGQLPEEFLFYKKLPDFSIIFSKDAKLIYYSNHDHSIATQEFINANPLLILPHESENQTFTFIKENHTFHSNSIDKIQVKDLYKNIDFFITDHTIKLEKIFHIHPGANLDDIKIKIRGIHGYKLLKNGDIVIYIKNKKITLSKPKAFQVYNKTKKRVNVSYKILSSYKDSLIYGFNVAKYDKTKTLIIDPIIQTSFIGGSSNDKVTGIIVDPKKNDVYVVGYTSSHDFPGITGAPDTKIEDIDAFVAKFNSELNILQQATFLGGNKKDIATSIVINPNSGDVYVAGYTESQDFPKTWGGADPVFFGQTEGFLALLTPDLKLLQRSSFIGGNNNDYVNSIEVDLTTGDVIVAGYTNSIDIPNTRHGAQNILAGGTDGFLSRFKPSLDNILASTYFGGEKDDEITAIKLYPQLNQLFIAGKTTSTFLPAITGGADTSLGGNQDGFVSSLEKDLSQIYQSTFLGGSNDDAASSIAISQNTKEVFVAGYTLSSDFPLVKGSFDETIDVIDGFVSRLEPSLKTIKSSTFIGGNNFDYVHAIVVNENTSEVIVAGETQSNNFPKISGGFDMIFAGGKEGFVGRLTADLKNLVQASYFGGSGVDYIITMSIHPTTGFLYLGGGTSSHDLPLLSGGADTVTTPNEEEGFVTIMSSDLMLTAPTYTLTITKEQKGTGVGDVNATGCVIRWNQNTGTCTGNPTKLITITGIPKNDSQWLGWSKGTGSAINCTGTQSCSFTLQSNSSIVATFDSPLPVYSVKVTKSGTGKGDVNATNCKLEWKNNEGICRVKSGTRITLQATPDSNSTFTGWKSGTGSARTCTGTNPCVFETTTNSTIVAEFTTNLKPRLKLTLFKFGDGNGDIKSEGCNLEWKLNRGECLAPEGTKITLTPLPDAFSLFKGWQEPKGSTTACKDDKPCTFNLDTNSTVSAYFQRRTDCVFLINPSRLNISSKKGIYDLQISTTNNQCSWMASTQEKWIKILSPVSGSGDGTIKIEVEENTSLTSRVGTIIIANQTVTITQEGRGLERAQLVKCDLNGDKLDDALILYKNGTLSYTYYNTRLINIQNNLVGGLNCADINGDGNADIIGIKNDGSISYTLNLGTSWFDIPAYATKLYVEDLNGDKIPDLVAINDKDEIYISYNLKTFEKLPGHLIEVSFGDFNASRPGLEIVGLNKDGEIYLSKDLQNWERLPGNLSLLRTGDINGDGKPDLAGINSKGEIYITTDLENWRNVPGRLSYLVLGDLDGNSKKDIFGYNDAGEIYYTLDLKGWTRLGQNIYNLTPARINADEREDIYGIDQLNRVNFNINLNIWIVIY